MNRAAVDPYAYPPRGLDREGAARYLGLDTARFDKLVKLRKLPGPRRIDSASVWDRLQLEAAFEAFPNEIGESALKVSSDTCDSAHPNVYTPKTLAERWRCSGTHVRNMIKRGDLPAFLYGGKLLRIRVADVIAYENVQTIGATNRVR